MLLYFKQSERNKGNLNKRRKTCNGQSILPAVICVGIVTNIFNTRKSVSYDFQTTRNAPRFFRQLFEVFRNRIKHSFVCLI